MLLSQISYCYVFVFVFYVVIFAILLIPTGKLYYRISHCNVSVYVTLAYVVIVPVLNCNVFATGTISKIF